MHIFQQLYLYDVVCDSGTIRLVGGSNQYDGRIEICINNRWGSVCSNNWDATDASVACKQLGYSEHSKLVLWKLGENQKY